jgi:hypothetical protein
MVCSLTLFKNLFDTKTEKFMSFSSFDEFEKLLYKLSKVERKGKRDAPLISPATYLPESTRKNVNVIEWSGWAALDIDTHEFKGDLQNELFSRYGNWRYVCYSTASSTVAQPKFRLVFELNGNLEASKIRQFWFALNTELDAAGDRQCKDLSRMYYIPATYAGANNFIFSNTSGHAIDPDALILKHPSAAPVEGRTFMDRLPPELQSQVVKYRSEAMERKSNIQWGSYRDCPFVNRNLVREYSSIAHTDGSGRYAMIYKIMSSIAVNAVKQEYPITSYEIAELIRELDRETSNKYQTRNLTMEADRAIEFAYKNT